MEEICISIASKILEEPVALIGRQLNYLIYYDSNIESLKDALKKIDDKKNDVQRSVDAAKRNGATIKDQVQSWLEDVSKTFHEAQELETKVNRQRRCLYGLCPSLKSRYSLSRKAKKIAQGVLDLKLDEGLSNNVANPAPLQQLGSIISSEGFKGFESRKAVINHVLSALRNEKTRIIGICGMGGVGKTTMVREIIKRLEETSELFDDVVMSTVSATVNIRTIQAEIAEPLGMKLDEAPESLRARKLHERIKKSGGGGRLGVQKVTNQEHCSAISLVDVKLDDNYADGLECPKLELLQLKNSSSSSEYSNHFKRLRELKVLAFLGMDMSGYLASKRSLPFGEPKYLHTLCLEDCELGDISHVIGGLKNLEVLSFARSKINKLPIEIGLLYRLRMLDATDCKGLEEIPHGVLSNLRRLEELYMAESFLNWGPATGSKDETSMASLDEKVEEIISKERMEDDNASHRITFPRFTVLKLFRLPILCGFYTGNQRDSTYEPNDESVNKMKETRNDNQVAGSTSSKSKVAQVGASCNAVFPSHCISWLPNLEQLQVTYLGKQQWSIENSELEELGGDSLRGTEGLEENNEPKELVGDSLTSEQGSKENNEPIVNVVFDLQEHDSAFSQLQNLDVVVLNGVEHLWNNIQPGFQGFQNIRYLRIGNCKSLKYVCPYEIYKLLVNLQYVEISFCENMETIVLAAASIEDNIHEEGKEIGGSGAMTLFPKLLNTFTLSGLTNLERFCPDAYSFAWSSSTRTMKVINCPKLKTLGFAPVSKMLLVVAETLGREESGGASSSSSSTGSGCVPLVCLQSRPSTRKFTQILPRPISREVKPANLQTSTARDNNVEHLFVSRCDLLEVIFLVRETPSTQAFDKLRKLRLRDLRMLSHIWEKGLQVSSGFGNLRFLQVWRCHNLRYLFSPHIAKLLTCLETIEVSHCSAMEKIVGEVEGGGETIKDELTFPHVNSIRLKNLPKLESFCSQAYTMKWPALEKVKVYECPKLKAFAPESLYV
ncbi:hypothetical protein ACE6H2_006192 [Prunus campanulata]